MASPPGTSPQNPAYTIFRKCFCLLPNYKNASLSFRVRADDTIQVWVNTQLNVALAPTIGNWNSPTPWASKPSQPSWFRVGRNCIYVLVEDYHGFMGFDLVGSVQADGLMPLPAAGPQQQFQCPCESPTGIASARARASDEDQAVVQAILALAEKRRAERVIVRPDGQRP